MALLEIKAVSVSFGGLQALSEVDLDVEPGRVTGLIGPNGAGKTTLFNVITGLQTPGRGRVVLDGRDITATKPHRRARLGIARTFQRLEVFGTMTVRDNVLVAAETAAAWTPAGVRPGDVADEMLERVGLRSAGSMRVETLPTGTARLVELARAMASRPKVLLLDEPSSGLNGEETAAMGILLAQLADSGLAVLLVEHDMAFVMGTCARIHVLDFGRMIAAGTPAETQASVQVRAAYLGEERADPDAGNGRGARSVSSAPSVSTAPEVAAGPVATAVRARGPASLPTLATAPSTAVLELRDVRAAYGTIDVLHGVSLAVRPGQVFALLGPNGAGKSTTLKVASGQLMPTGGDILLCGYRVTGCRADALARAGVCTVPEGRGIFPNLTVTENLRMASYSGARHQDIEEQAFGRFPMLADRRRQVAGTLSGGEQQMLALARGLACKPAVLILDELSMGLAPIVVERLYETVAGIAAEDVSILIVEQFVHEVLGVADIAAVMVNGKIEFTGQPAVLNESLSATYLGAHN